MFEQASRLKLRFESDRGLLNIEDLWDLPLTARSNGVSLDSVAKDLNKRVKDSGEESFVVKKSEVDAILELKLNIVKRVIEIKLTEADSNEKKLMVDARKQQIISIIADKGEEALKSKTVKELKEELDNL